MPHFTNGALHQGDKPPSTGRTQDSFAGAAGLLPRDAQQKGVHAQEAARELQDYITGQVRRSPVATLAMAAGVGYLLGGGLGTKLTLSMFTIASRLAMALVAREMEHRVVDLYSERQSR